MIRRVLPFLLILASPCAALAEDPRVDVVLLMDAGFPPSGSRKWLDTLRRVKITNVQIRKGRDGESLRVENRGTERSPAYRITGALTSRNTLRVPGKEFRLTDGKRIRDWVDKLRRDGIGELGGPRKAFGLTTKQLLEAHQQLSRPVTIDTMQMSRRDAFRRVAVPLGVTVDPSVRFEADTKALGEEYKGVSSGSAMALMLRPLGAALTIVRTARGIQYVATDSRKAKEAWPNGWPLDKKKASDVAPQLFKFTEDVEVRGVALDALITALKPRLEAPLFYDHNSLAALGIEPAKVKVTLPSGRSYYKKIMDRALTPAMLKMEVRLDENDKAFFWITTLRNPFK